MRHHPARKSYRAPTLTRPTRDKGEPPMKSNTHASPRTNRKADGARLMRYPRPALALALTLSTVLMIWSGAAAASCNFLLTLASIGSANGQVIGPRGVATDSPGN